MSIQLGVFNAAWLYAEGTQSTDPEGDAVALTRALNEIPGVALAWDPEPKVYLFEDLRAGDFVALVVLLHHTEETDFFDGCAVYVPFAVAGKPCIAGTLLNPYWQSARVISVEDLLRVVRKGRELCASRLRDAAQVEELRSVYHIEPADLTVEWMLDMMADAVKASVEHKAMLRFLG